jgi:thiaminase (transcriptional activator TenA)
MARRRRLFDRLKDDAGRDWSDYVGHEFVRRLAAGTLPEAAFRHYLVQDFRFLVHFARAYGLAAFKAETLADIRAAAAALSAIVEVEMGLHVKFAARWGISAAEMERAPEHNAAMAYTRFVLERGLAGDLLDLHVALAPCVIGYGEIGRRLAPAARRRGHPYRDWIRQYAGAEYQAVAGAAADTLDRLAAERGGRARYPALLDAFKAACRLESGFWQMGLDAAR